MEDSEEKTWSQLLNPVSTELSKIHEITRSPAVSIWASMKMDRFNSYVYRRGDLGGYQEDWMLFPEILAWVRYISLLKKRWLPMTSGLHPTI